MESVNNPIQIMLDEHEIISSVDEIIKKLDHYWDKSEEGFVQCVELLIRFFREFSDKYHHYKEEQVLFPKMENHVDFQMQSMISELSEHHEMFRAYTRSIEQHTRDHQFSEAYAILRTYMNELLDHIAAENDVLFVMLESLFSEKELENMYFNFKDIDADLGENRKVELSNSLDEIMRSFEIIDSPNRS